MTLNKRSKNPPPPAENELWEGIDRLTEAERAHSERVVATLRAWKAPRVSIGAAMVAPLLESDSARPELRPGVFSEEAVTLATRLIEWRKSFARSQKEGAATNAEWLSLALGRLYRLAYLDVPSFSFILLLLADHEVTMSQAGAVDKDVALHTQKVFAPLAEMLGVWSLYRSWVERSFSVLFPEQYSRMRAMLGSPEEYDEKSFKSLLAKQPQKPSPHEAKKTKDGPGGLYLRDKAEAYLRIKPELLSRLDKMGVSARVIPISHHAGLALRRIHEGESEEDVARRLSIRVICRSVADCYTILGIIHSLGPPVSVGSILHFKDHIASPQPNGYRALHATITFRGFRADGGGSIVVECRIVTEYMHRLNQDGVIGALRRSPGAELPSSAWWYRLPELDRQLSKTGVGGDYSSIKAYLNRHEPRSPSDPLYVFTPRGEIVLLPSDSTSLDFAYSIHTHVGHHAMRIEVNGKSVPHGYPLRNGDIVRVHHHPNFAGPDISWLGLVKTSWARTSIRRGLARRASAAHQGRAYFEAALLKALNWYEREKGYKLTLSSEHVDDFLLERSRADGYTEIQEFYAKINGDNDRTRILVEQMISAEIASGVVNARGRPITSVYEPRQIGVCMICRPAPGEPIVGLEHSQLPKKQLTVHREGRAHVTAAKDSKQVPLGWAEPVTLDTLDLSVFKLSGNDRPGLLREVLEVVYQARKVELLKVDAQTNGDGHAAISLLLRGEWVGGFDKVSERLGKIGGVHELNTSPPSPAQRMALSTSLMYTALPPPTPNPYTAEEVYHRGIFFNRQELLSDILWWLREPPPRETMILHGQRRVGKTSLVKHLIREYLIQYRLAQPVFVDLQGLDGYSSGDVAAFIVRKVFEGSEQSAPPREHDEPPWIWADRALTEAVRRHERLLIVIDEFNFLIDAERNGSLDVKIYDNLRFLMNAHRDINWLLVVQDTHFLDRELWLSAGALFQRTRTLPVRHLERDWANVLIFEPARKCGVVPRNKMQMLNRVMRLTTGNPFLIHLLCWELVERAKRLKRPIVDHKDLAAAAAVVLHAGQRNFAHFNKNLIGIREVVMAAVATALRNRKSAPEVEIFKMLEEAAPEIRAEVVEKSLMALAVEGQLAFKCWREGGERRVTIPIELFRQFITRDLNLPDAVEKWRASKQSAARAK
jgi:guanosine-3',5'-bis(diphosphate) 3'-pyrophosphohydrolase